MDWDDRLYLDDIIEAVRRIREFTSRMDFETFKDDITNFLLTLWWSRQGVSSVMSRQETHEIMTVPYNLTSPIIHEGVFGMRVRYGDLTHEQCFTPRSIRQVLAVCGFNDVFCFEDQPVVHGLKSALRFLVWKLFTLPVLLLLLAETGGRGHILSQNMLITARRGLEIVGTAGVTA